MFWPCRRRSDMGGLPAGYGRTRRALRTKRRAKTAIYGPGSAGVCLKAGGYTGENGAERRAGGGALRIRRLDKSARTNSLADTNGHRRAVGKTSGAGRDACVSARRQNTDEPAGCGGEQTASPRAPPAVLRVICVRRPIKYVSCKGTARQWNTGASTLCRKAQELGLALF